MTRLAFFGELARMQIKLKAESFEPNNDADPSFQRTASGGR